MQGGGPLARHLIRILDKTEDRDSPTRRTPPAVVLAWRSTAGPYLTEHSRVISYRDEILVVAVDSPIIRQEFERLHQDLLLGMRAVLTRPIEAIRFVVDERVTPGPKNGKDMASTGGRHPAPRARDAPRDDDEGDDSALTQAAGNAPAALRPVLQRVIRKHEARTRSRSDKTRHE